MSLFLFYRDLLHALVDSLAQAVFFFCVQSNIVYNLMHVVMYVYIFPVLIGINKALQSNQSLQVSESNTFASWPHTHTQQLPFVHTPVQGLT